jgi:hypothetical protein
MSGSADIDTPSLFDSAPRSALWRQFVKFDEAHPDVWRNFQDITFDLIVAGVKHYSADSVLHVIRFHRATSTAKEAFRINNNFSACYARKWASCHPKQANFFARRQSKADPRR